MNIQMISNLETPIGEVLKAADDTGALIQSETKERYAVLPLDNELIDYLLERNPRFIEECAQRGIAATKKRNAPRLFPAK